MDKRVILAVAGAGKTYHICHDLNPNNRNLIIAYTNQNVKNIYNELRDAFGFIPKDTIIMTFHSFIYRFLIRPFDKAIGNCYGIENFTSSGVSLNAPPDSSILQGSIRRKNPFYHTDDKLKHYLCNDRYYCDHMSKLIIKTKITKKFSLINECCNNLNKFFDYIYVDEMQDFREYNYELLVEIIKKVNNIVLVGDYYQHSVNGTNNHGKPFQIKKEKNRPISYDEYIKLLNTIGLKPDNVSLSKTRRCPLEICEFITNKLNIAIEPHDDNTNDGKIIWVSDDGIDEILNNKEIIKLVWDQAKSYMFNAITWGYSKGDTYQNVCLILTKSLENIDDVNFKMIDNSTKNKLYVALSRTKGNLYIVKYNQFKLVENNYFNENC